MNLETFCNVYWYTLKSEIDYNWDRYNNWIPSVTSILKLLDDESFNNFATNFSWLLNSSAKEWTRVHKEAEDFFTKWSWIKNINKNFIKFHTLFNVRIIDKEKTIIKDWLYPYSWTIDLIWDISYNNIKWVYNIDYKNSCYHSTKYELQLMWYKYLNWNNWILVYGKWELKTILANDELEEVWIQLLEYFYKLKDGNTTRLLWWS